MAKSLFLSLLLLVSTITIAKEHKILKITSNGDPSYYFMGIIMDESNENAIGMYKHEIAQNGKEYRWDYTLDQLSQKKGVVLVERSGCDVVRVRSLQVAPASGGTLEIIAKKNCLTGKTFTKNLEVTRVNADKFDVYMGGSYTQHLFFKAGTFGLKDIIAK